MKNDDVFDKGIVECRKERNGGSTRDVLSSLSLASWGKGNHRHFTFIRPYHYISNKVELSCFKGRNVSCRTL